jgi:hypothetical protein
VLLWLLEFDLRRDAFVSPASPSCDTFGKIDNKKSTLYGFIKILFYITYNINNDIVLNTQDSPHLVKTGQLTSG